MTAQWPSVELKVVEIPEQTLRYVCVIVGNLDAVHGIMLLN